MIITAFALALAVAPPAEKPVESLTLRGDIQSDMNVKQAEPAYCPAGGEVLAKAEDKAKTQTPLWKPKDYPEADYFYAVNKQIEGCAIPVSVGRGDVLVPPAGSRRTTVLMNGKPLK